MTQGSVFIAENNGVVVGFANGGRERSGKYKSFDGELYSIYLLDEYQGMGFGKQLFMAVVEELKRLQFNSFLVLVLKDNQARSFYESMGARHVDSIEVDIAGKKLTELVYGWEHINGHI
ncbi:N-acetyltransferase family protein [Alkalihalophilus sp. As8PL]|uniref:N-acetyltransferase family protein n=1 Tax=Alkalihalophilus sp. As8PL TaxID=3237103 RepID=A0AB39BWV0_9BACI